MAAASPDNIGPGLRALGRPFLIDPRTPIFQFASQNGTDRYARLAAVYGPPFGEVLSGRRRFQHLTREDWRQAAIQTSAMATDLTYSAGAPPLMVLAPYLAVDHTLAATWSLALALLDDVVDQGRDVPVAAVALLGSSPPSEPDLDAMEAMLGAIERRVTSVFIWLDECREQMLAPQEVKALAHLVDAHPRLHVYNLYGGYLSLVLYHFGLAGVASGLGYAESRRARDLGRGGGPVPGGYYLPLVHALVEPKVAEEVLAVGGDRARCQCHACKRASPSGLDAHGLMVHYLLARDSERTRIHELALDSLIDELWDAFRLATRCVELMPEQFQLALPHHHLESWARGLAAATAPPT